MASSSDILKAAEPVPCPDCGEMFLLPEGMEKDTSLACPHCDSEITGQQIVAALLPTAAIVKGEKQSNGEEAAQSTETREAASQSSAISHAFDEQSYTIPKPLKTAQRRSSSRYPQRKKKPRKKKKDEKPSGFSELWRIALGFVLALPIAQLILWWGFTVDPLGLAPRVHNFAPFLVPSSVYKPAPVTKPEKPVNKDMPGTQSMDDTNNIPISIYHSK